MVGGSGARLATGRLGCKTRSRIYAKSHCHTITANIAWKGDRCKYTYYYNMFQKNRSFFTHPNLQTHPNLPKGKEQITPHIDIQPPPSLPRRGGTDTLVAYYQKVIDNQSNLHPPVYDSNGVTCISPSGENERGLMSAEKSAAESFAK